MNLRRLTVSLLAAVSLLALTARESPRRIVPRPGRTHSSPPPQKARPLEGSEFRVGMEVPTPQTGRKVLRATPTTLLKNVPGAYAEGYDADRQGSSPTSWASELVIVKFSWDGLIDALNRGQIDAIIAGMMDTAERRESINFRAYKENNHSMMVLADSPYERHPIQTSPAPPCWASREPH